MSFRLATEADSALFYRWRERAEVQPWYGGPKTNRASHDEWFARRFQLSVTMLVWTDERIGGEGVVRVDSNGELAFDATHPRSMLEELLAQWPNTRLKVTVDEGDRIKQLALKAAGFGEYPVRFYSYRP